MQRHIKSSPQLRRLLCCLAAVILASLAFERTATGGPAQVILLRHAEKPRDDSDEHLSERGKMRAEALATCLTTNSSFLSNGAPVALFAPRITRRGNVRRPYETLQPLAKPLNLTIQTPFGRENHRELADMIMKEPAYDGKTVVICWVHDYLPDLVKDFGVGAKRSLNWKDGVYDRFWVITFAQTNATLADLPQRLLPGDRVE